MKYAAHLDYLEDLFLNTASVYTWRFDKNFELEDSNCPTEMILKNIFMFSSCPAYAREHFSEHDCPLFLFDDLSFLWAAVPEYVGESLTSIYLLGPVFGTHTSEDFIRKKMNVQNMSVKSRKTLLNLVNRIPVMPTAFFSHYVCLLYYTLNERQLNTSDIPFQRPSASGDAGTVLQSVPAKHTPYYQEQLMLKNIEEGIMFQSFSTLLSSVQAGLMCPGDPIRQKKDEAIGIITLFTRAAIRGGYPEEDAFNLSDYYAQTVENADSVSKVLQIIETMYVDFINRVGEVRRKSLPSDFVRDCMAYVDRNLTTSIQLDVLAKDMGYAKYYLTARFKQESGISLKDYIQKRRVDYAKMLLKNPCADIQEISESLLFSTPSYFTSVFRKITGMTPTEYRKQR